MPLTRKIINDPVHGFITLDHPLVLEIVAHPWYQRLRRIHQMAMAQLVYPGAVHSRLHHSLGAYHLVGQVITELRGKGIEITPEEELATRIAILLHDIGHGPYSHALETLLAEGVHHETLSLLIMQRMNEEKKGALDMALSVFTDTYPKKFLHQLISGQLDADRLDYLSRDSFFSGVSEGVIAYDRIIKMLTVHGGELMVEEKGIYSIEKFLVARRLMYWQVYLHKTVLGAEKMLVKIMERARQTGAQSSSPFLNRLLNNRLSPHAVAEVLPEFCELDDYDIMAAVKQWMRHPDKALSFLCQCLVNRRLVKTRLQATPFDAGLVAEKREKLVSSGGFTEEESAWLVFTGEAANTTYNPNDEKINILFRDGTVKDISEVDHALIHQTLSSPVKKFYICYIEPQTS